MDGEEKDLQALKLWLFNENVRIEAEKHKLLEQQNRYQQKLTQDQKLFDQKLQILQNGFMQLDADRRKFEREQKAFYQKLQTTRTLEHSIHMLDVGILFAGVENQITLRKRYKDLLKIFHPDNLAGDREAVLLIKDEYERLKEELA